MDTEAPAQDTASPGDMTSHRALYTGLYYVDTFTGGFMPGQLVTIDSPTRLVFGAVSELCVNAVESGDELEYIDGGNSVDPYSISAVCKRRGLDPWDTLDRINVSRAFTAYQMVALINDRLPGLVERSRAQTVVVSSLLDLLSDGDIPWREARQLAKRCLARLKALSTAHGLTTVAVNCCYIAPWQRRSLDAVVRETSDRVVRLNALDFALMRPARRVAEPQLRTLMPRGQMAIDYFLRGREHG
jgi:hypothetical protein